MSVENCTNRRANWSANCDYILKPCGVFEKKTPFTQILNQDLQQGKLMAAINSRK